MIHVLLKLVRNYRKCELNSDFFTLIFLNMDISVTINPFELRFSVGNLNFPLEGSVSQNIDLGPTFHFEN